MNREWKLMAGRLMEWPAAWLIAAQIILPVAAFAESGQALDPACASRLAESGAELDDPGRASPPVPSGACRRG